MELFIPIRFCVYSTGNPSSRKINIHTIRNKGDSRINKIHPIILLIIEKS